MMRFSTVAAITAVLVAASGVAGCSGSSSGSGTAAHEPEKQAAGIATGSAGGFAAGDALAPTATGTAPHDAAVSSDRALPQMPSAVIKTGRLSIRLGHDGLARSIDRAQHVVDSYGGFHTSHNNPSRQHQTAPPWVRGPGAG